MEEAVRDGVAEQRERLMESFRIYGGQYAELSRRFAAWLGLHSTDATAVLEIAAAEERGTPLSPARLSERISLSTGATTALLNRLEAAGHITRAREHSDRRIVTLRSGGHIQERADEFFGPLAHRLDATMSHYPPQFLEQVEAFMADLSTTMDSHLTEQDRGDTGLPPQP
ncbi:MarR family winged helix-turn-helix transcriptional regulator [Streptomyces sp. NPDC056361]|uniref:MarR family winged helix-turn-helix transcriptional regulator n=1 Tax=Streptomyces sp. NPDC056361 TaxID=3345795 RepID=UPI0035D8D037